MHYVDPHFNEMQDVGMNIFMKWREVEEEVVSLSMLNSFTIEHEYYINFDVVCRMSNMGILHVAPIRCICEDSIARVLWFV